MPAISGSQKPSEIEVERDLLLPWQKAWEHNVPGKGDFYIAVGMGNLYIYWRRALSRDWGVGLSTDPDSIKNQIRQERGWSQSLGSGTLHPK